ncbi:MAG: hypothetical protein LBC02_14770 [Planctomycetaceae bacterium]|jgi:hypothetical protein|nr:hypothetical protein [Planctomycetaceae bacterium]
MSIKHLFFEGLLLFLCVFFTACGSSGPEVNVVEGTVTLDGQPFADVTVTFMPTGNVGDMGFAGTDAQGRYQLSMLGAKPGAGITKGEYNVTFDRTILDVPKPTKTESADPNVEPSTKNNMDRTKQLVPKKYLTASTSGFTVKVEKGKNVHNFDLLSK